MGGHGYSSPSVSLSVCLLPEAVPRPAGIVVVWFVCLFVTGESTHLGALALRLQHG